MKARLPKKVRCVETGEVFENLHAAARKYNRSPYNLSQIISYNMPWSWAGLHWEAITPNRIMQYLAKPEAGEAKVFNSRKELAEALGITKWSAKYHLDSHTPIKGYILERKIGESHVGI